MVKTQQDHVVQRKKKSPKSYYSEIFDEQHFRYLSLYIDYIKEKEIKRNKKGNEVCFLKLEVYCERDSKGDWGEGERYCQMETLEKR